MSWVCEEYPPDDSLWEMHFPSIINAIQFLFSRLKLALEAKELRHYFILKINIISSLPDGTRLAIIDRINNIVTGTKQHIPNFNNVIIYAQTIIDLSQSILDVMESYFKGDFISYLSQHVKPEFYEQFANCFLELYNSKKINTHAGDNSIP